MVKAINELNDTQRTYIGTALSVAEALLLYSVAGKLGIASSASLSGVLSDVNGRITSPLRQDVQYGDVIIKTSATSMHDDLNVHAPREQLLITILRRDEFVKNQTELDQ